MTNLDGLSSLVSSPGEWVQIYSSPALGASFAPGYCGLLPLALAGGTDGAAYGNSFYIFVGEWNAPLQSKNTETPKMASLIAGCS